MGKFEQRGRGISGATTDEWPLIGRDAELERVRRLLADRSRDVVVAGAPGIGKTRLATECLALAARQGFVPLRVAATRASTTLPFGAFAAFLPDLVASTDSTELLRQVGRAISERGQGNPVALLVDDAHFLDEASAALTHQLAASERTFVIATVRAGERASDAVIALWKDALAERIELGPLSEADIDALLAVVLGAPADRGTVRLLSERSQGNALFLRELVLAALEAEALRDEGGVWRLHGKLPPSTRLVELVEARLGGLADDERRLLEAMAIGEPLGIELLDHPNREGSVEMLERRGLVQVQVDGRRLQARLAHPLYGEVLRSRLSPLRTRAISQTLAEALTKSGARRREDVLRAATWWLDAGSLIEPDVMVAASREAHSRNDLDLSERLSRAGYQAGGGFEAGLQLGLVLSQAGRVEEAEATLAVLDCRNDSERAAVALARIANLYTAGQLDRASRIADEAEATIDDPAALVDLAAWRLCFLVHRAELSEARHLGKSLLPKVSGRSLVMVCGVAGYLFAIAGRLTAALDASDRGLAAHQLLKGPPLWFGPFLHTCGRCEALTFAGHLSEADAVASEELDKAIAEGSLAAQGWLKSSLSRTLLAQGRLEAAARRARTAGSLFRQAGQLALLGYTLESLATALALQGRIEDAAAVLARRESLSGASGDAWHPYLPQARAWTAASAGDLAAARNYLSEAAAVARSQECWVLETAALHDIARVGRPDEVAPRLQELAAIIEGPLAPARAAHATALAEKDPAGLEQASAAFEEMKALLLAAEAAADAAVAWRREGEARRAAAAERRARALAAQCEGARTPALMAIGARAMLSPQELEIARLAAAGLPNKQIAARLSFSVRTVENKLHSAYGKLGVSGREELGEALKGF